MKQETEIDVHQLKFKELENMKDGDGKKIQPSPEELEGLLLLQMLLEPEEDEDKKEEEG